MTAPREHDRLIAAFLADGPAEVSPRLLAAIRDDVHETHQRARRRPWRTTPMPRLLLVLAPLAAVILVVGALALGGGSDTPVVATAPPGPVASAAGVPAFADPASAPVVAPGEEWIAFEGVDGYVTLIRPDGTGRHRALDNDDAYQATPDWSPDGTQLLFTRGNGTASNLWIMNADGTGGRELTPDIERCAPCPDQWSARWSPDGSSVAFLAAEVDAGRVLRNDLAVVDVATGTVRTILSSDTQEYAAPSWSPDGKRLVLATATWRTLATAGRPGQVPESVALAIVDLAAPEPALEPIPGLPAYPQHPDWSPDGTRIVFRTNPYVRGSLVDAGAGSAIYTVAPDGGNLVELLRTAAGEPLLGGTAWTPDGLRVLHVSRDTPDADPVLRILDPADGSTRSATGAFTTYGGEPRLRPLP
jgi:Tol biopolymer transport system component